MKDNLAIRLLKRLAATLYDAADRIVTVGEGYARRIARDYGVSQQKMDVITNGVDLSLFTLDEAKRAAVRRQYDWEKENVVLYLGTHGMAHGLEFVLEAASQLANRSGLRFVFVGDGAEKPKLMAIAEQQGLSNVTFLSEQPKESVVGLYAASDVCLVPLRKAELFAEVLPSKLFEIMAMRRPIVLSVDGEARKLVERAGAGVFVEPESVPALCEAIESIIAQPARATRMGENGRRHVEEYFSRRALARRYLTVLDGLVRERAPATAPARRAA